MSSVLRVTLIRLTECEGNVKQLIGRHGQLTELGHRQAQQARVRLINLGVQLWASSDNSACKETSTILAGGSPVAIIHEFNEPPYPEWEGLHLTEVERGWPVEWKLYWNPAQGDAERVVVPKGESLRATFERAKFGLDRLYKEHAGGVVAICTHGEIVRVLTAGLLGAPLENLFRFRGRNGAVTIFDYDGCTATFETVNDTAHLVGLDPKDFRDYK